MRLTMNVHCELPLRQASFELGQAKTGDGVPFWPFSHWKATDRDPGVIIQEGPVGTDIAPDGAFIAVPKNIGKTGLRGVLYQVGVQVIEAPDPSRPTIQREVASWQPAEDFVRLGNALPMPGWLEPRDDPRLANVPQLTFAVAPGKEYSDEFLLESIAERHELPVSTGLADHDELEHGLMQLVVRNSPLLTWCLIECATRRLSVLREARASHPPEPSFWRRITQKAQIAKALQDYDNRVEVAETGVGKLTGQIDQGVSTNILDALIGSNPFNKELATTLFLDAFMFDFNNPIATKAEILDAFDQSVQSLTALGAPVRT